MCTPPSYTCFYPTASPVAVAFGWWGTCHMWVTRGGKVYLVAMARIILLKFLLASRRNAYNRKGLIKSSYFLHMLRTYTGVVLASARGEKR